MVSNWERLPSEPPLAALASTHALHRAIASWQVALVKEAAGNGASWEEIGTALGTTRQGAWARFRVPLEEGEGEQSMEDRQAAKQKMDELWRAGRARFREMESRWREEETRLREQIQMAKSQLADGKRRYSRDRRDAKDKLRRDVDAARAKARGW